VQLHTTEEHICSIV